MQRHRERLTITQKPLSIRRRRIYNFLHANAIGVLSSTSTNGRPHGAVIYFTVNHDFEVSFLTKSLTRKYDNLTHDNHVMLTVFDPATQTTAQISGLAHEIADSKTINKIAGTVLASSIHVNPAGVPPIEKLNAGDYVAFKIKPSQIRLAIYANPQAGEYHELFDSIESFELTEID